ncbi:uncharacterized protein LOC128461802 [Pleuronectes platessa]|uniref:uncharacterized protein LOC128461802 n=1 Tax=Pleuronectes platessa TaxID=8262 RepID=UPI00232A2AC6|nr:uncharacterized protein LOC128461802 [Pleuronectes platessa]
MTLSLVGDSVEATMSRLLTLIRFYFVLGLRHWEILVSLSNIDGVCISLSTLRRHLSSLRLFRRKDYSDLLDVAVFLQDQLSEYGMLHGYKMMHLKSIQVGYVVTQETIRHLLKILDPRGVELRRRKRLRRRLYQNPGPNFLWHIDSYDKLKPYGICINGAIDGFSRMLVWLHAYSTSSDPKVIAGYFIDEVSSRNGTATRIRSDLGTENCFVEQMQIFMRHDHMDEFSNRCFLYGSSNHNQRIEQWWGFLRKQHAQFWMNVFQDLKESDHFSGDFLDKSLIQFTCLEIIERELQDVVHLWNTHRIRSSRNAVSPGGRPVMMYTIPQLFGAREYLKEVSQQKIQACREECLQRGPCPCDNTVFDICCFVMAETNLHPPTSPEEAIELYKFLRAYIYAHI